MASMSGRIGAYRLHATHDRRETTAAARAKFLSRFEIEVDPDGKLPAEERSRRAEYARRAFFAALAFKRVQAAQKRTRRHKQARPSVVARSGRPGAMAGDPGGAGTSTEPQSGARIARKKPRLLQESAALEERDVSTHQPPV